LYLVVTSEENKHTAGRRVRGQEEKETEEREEER
jgi:hypothetical protein